MTCHARALGAQRRPDVSSKGEQEGGGTRDPMGERGRGGNITELFIVRV